MTEQKRFISIRYKMFVIISVIVLIPVLIVGIISYNQTTLIIDEKFISARQNIVNQITDNIRFIINDILDLTLYLIQDENTRNFLKLDPVNSGNEIELTKLKINNSLSNLVYTNEYINSIEITGFNGSHVETKYSGLSLEDEIQNYVISLDGGYFWFLDSTPTEPENYYLSISRVLKDLNNLDTNLAILRINIEEEFISRIFENIIEGEIEQFYLLDQNDMIVASRDKSLIRKNLAGDLVLKLRGSAKSFYTQIDGEKYLATHSSVESNQWKIINLVSYSELTRSRNVILNSIVFGIIVSIVLSIILAFLVSMMVVSPLKQYRFLMNRIENSNFDILASERGNDEFALLGKSFNKMAGKLKELMSEITITANKKREAELKALEAQINPHFLYNTLDTIYWKARLEKAFDTADLVEALSKLFRLSLNRGNETTTVRTELENLNNYIFIQKNRYSDLITFQISMAPETGSCKVLKLLIQPLVENSIYHGIKNAEGSGTISISIYKKEDLLIYDIHDTGLGVDRENMNRLLASDDTTKKSSIGIKNVHDRIRLYFGSNYGLEYIAAEKGTLVRVTQPFIIEGISNA